MPVTVVDGSVGPADCCANESVIVQETLPVFGPHRLPSPDGTQFTGQAEVFMSLTGILGMGIVGPAGPMISSFGMCLAFLCLPGLLFSFSGVFLTQRRRAAYGTVFGAMGSMFLLTFYLTMFLFPYSLSENTKQRGAVQQADGTDSPFTLQS